jgi:4-amino-4-deoxy-L-arabinose transferase-like glycosyltransferase
MRAQNPPSYFKRYSWLLLILLTAVFLRLFNLSSIPPGLTHDEADHGITAWSIANEDVRDIYFTIGYGREPLYDYVTASLMTFLGSTYFAGRIAASYFSILLIAAMFAWVRRAFDHTTALLTAAGLAVGFWPVMAGRQALRSTLLPTLFVLAVYLFWLGMEKVRRRKPKPANPEPDLLFLFAAAGIFLGLSIYTYIPARGLWIIFPALLIYIFIIWKALFRDLSWPTGLMLLVMLILAAPLIFYLAANPTAELRIQQLATPLLNATSGDWGAFIENVQQSLRLFFFAGDAAWRYNISGKPLFGPLMGLLFLIGIAVAIWHVLFHRVKEHNTWGWRYGPASFLALAWLVAGLLPVLITGSNLAMTQAIGMQPVLYLFPALTLVTAGQVKVGNKPLARRGWVPVGLFVLFLGTAVITYRDYFITWANSPEVRVQYESTLAAALEILNDGRGGPRPFQPLHPIVTIVRPWPRCSCTMTGLISIGLMRGKASFFPAWMRSGF